MAHYRLLCRSSHHNKKLQDDWQDSGASGFRFDIIESVADIHERRLAEQRHINAIPAALRYNVNTCIVRDPQKVPKPVRYESSHDDDDMVSTEEVAHILNRKDATVWLLAKQYGLPRYRIPSRGKRTFFRWGDIRAALDTPQRIDRIAQEDTDDRS